MATLTAGGTAAQSELPKQSPINVTPGAIQIDLNQPKLNVSYGHSDLELEYVRKDTADPAGCTTRHHEETEEAGVAAGAGHVTVAGVRYELEQFHFHTPSEHRFGGHADPLEMHFVHRSAAGRLLVIGVPLRAGHASTVDTVLAELAPECGERVAIHDVDLNSLLPANRSTLRYDGSLTTAPFSEDVQWFLTAELTVTPATIARFQGLFTDGNARPVQPLNGRTVTAVPQF
ncbi:carbonic anhydrase family protein [Amycolatopsis albispora]|uniref:carbonic anhydrase family protein n=1 Tax=Amycolatopsis albispora TaxID=1804986 RepID=UPI0013B3C5F4|nr:carbonic anhydrase family protein [Amycolatopsis albispora]